MRNIAHVTTTTSSSQLTFARDSLTTSNAFGYSTIVFGPMGGGGGALTMESFQSVKRYMLAGSSLVHARPIGLAWLPARNLLSLTV